MDRFHIQTVYACKYVDDREKGIIKRTPVKGQGNGIVKGKWTLKTLDKNKTRVTRNTDGTLEIPLPSLVKFMVAPVVAREFEEMVDTYVDNLCKTFSKPAKRKATAKKAAAKKAAFSKKSS